jgi:hypothetical protein
MMLIADRSSNFVEENGELTLVKENVIFSLVADKGAKVFADNAVPIGSVLFVKLFFDVLGHQKLDFEVVNCVLGLYPKRGTSFIASAIMSELSGMSIMFSFLITSVMCNLKLICFEFNN